MEALTGVVLAGGGLLAVAGVPKLTRPHETARALRSVGITFVRDWHVRLLAAAEVALGVVVVLTAARPALALTALAYVAFSVFLLVALRRGGVVSSCGCTGRADTPPTYAHLVMTTAFAVGAGVGAVTGAGGLLTLDRGTGGWAVPGVLIAAMVTGWLGWVVLTVLPRLTALRTAAESS